MGRGGDVRLREGESRGGKRKKRGEKERGMSERNAYVKKERKERKIC